MRIARVRFRPAAHDALSCQRLVEDQHFARLAVQFEEHQPPAVFVRVADRQELDDQRLARLDIDAGFLARLHAVEEHVGRQNARVRIVALMFGEIGEHARIEQIGQHVAIGGRELGFLFEFLARFGEIGRRQVGAGPIGEWRPAAQDFLLQCLGGNRPAAGPSRPSKNSTTDSGNASSRFGSSTCSGVRLLAIMNSVMSPTTFDDGVTLTMSPNSRLTAA